MIDPLTWLFSQAVRVRNARYDGGRAPVARLRLPVISVGNLSVGGSGKTPFVQTLGRWLTTQGIGYDVLSRGYRRGSRGVLRVDPAGPAELYGDEPLLLARTLEAPVFVGEDRFLAGLAAEASAKQNGGGTRLHIPRLHILDDGFQHRQLHRDFDVVLLVPGDLRGRLLPFGRLREPLSALTRAHAVAAPEELAPLLTRLARQHDANGFVTTEKDLVKLDAAELGGVCAPRLTIELTAADAKFASMLEAAGVR